MDWLLPEIAAELARYLTPQDLCACCSVSTHWRLVFDADQVWMGLCDPVLEEHLRTTPCVVEPLFSLPQTPGSTLLPVCRWRAAFLREQHLYSNWHYGNYRIVEHILESSKRKPCLESFLSDDFIAHFYTNSIELWDVRDSPPVCADSLVYDTVDKDYPQPVICVNGLVIIKCREGNFFRVVKADFTERIITVKYCIYFKQSTKLPEILCNVIDSVESERYPLDGFEILTLGTRCLGNFTFKKDFNSFYILDLESGVKVKEEPSPSLFGGGFKIFGPNKWSQNCHDVVVIGKDDPGMHHSRRVSVTCHVYHVKHLTFFPFKHKFWAPGGLVFSSYATVCAIINNFVATGECSSMVNDNDNDWVKVVRIFNYKTGHQLHVIEAYSDVQVIDNSCFLLINSTEYETAPPDVLLVVNPSIESVKYVVDCHLELCEVVGRKLARIKDLWHISHSRNSKIFKTAIKFPKFKEVNQASTRLILDGLDDKKIMILVYLW